MNISNESKVGILAAIGIALLYIGVNYLKGINVFNRGDNYHVAYAYSGGLSEGDPVQVDGYTIGRVKTVGLQKDQSGVDVTLNITEDVEIPDDSYAMIRGDLLGSKYIDLDLGDSKTMVKKEGTINGSIETSLQSQIKEELKPLTEKVKSMVESLDTAITVMRSLFTEDVVSDFRRSVTNIKNTLESFSKSAERVDQMIISEQQKIDDIITDVNSFTSYANESEGDLKTSISNLKAVTESLKNVDWESLTTEMEKAVTEINELTTKLNSGDGSLAQLVNDPELYDDLVSTINSLQKTLDNFAMDPEIRLVLFGNKKRQAEKAAKNDTIN